MTQTHDSMTPDDFRSLARFIHERTGILLDESKRHLLEARISRRLEEIGLETFEQYRRYLAIAPDRAAELEDLMARLAITDSGLYRGVSQFDYFERTLLPRLIAARQDSAQLRIWSAGCSTGEETYTIAAAVRRALGEELPDWHVEILGTDVINAALQQAELATYEYELPASQAGSLEPNDGFIHERNGVVRILPAVRALVSFKEQDLRDSLHARRGGLWDAIFCRHVLVYFDGPTREECLGLFYDRLAAHGQLILAHGESIKSDHALFLAAKGSGQHSVWTKRDASEQELEPATPLNSAKDGAPGGDAP
ncbi:MAG TPA: protein-glutamate O-methyltransferase CheR [Phycisphaerales bacterium]|nr:protein-glutamate O-methyltransferase CheR [Phycisphaerales bacterium]